MALPFKDAEANGFALYNKFNEAYKLDLCLK